MWNMKKSPIAFIAVIIGNNLFAQTGASIAANAAAEQAKQNQIYSQQIAQQQWQNFLLSLQQEELKKIYSKDPWRNINGTTNLARGEGWLEFQGVIMESRPDGVVFRGHFGKVLSLPYETTRIKGETAIAIKERTGNNYGTQTEKAASVNYQVETDPDADLFFVANFPYSARLSAAYQELVAFDEGYYTYTNNLQETVTVHRLNYGTPCVKTWSDAELAAAKQKVEQKKQATSDKMLKSNQALAAKGEPYGLKRMAERYRDGDGVEKDESKSAEYFKKYEAAVAEEQRVIIEENKSKELAAQKQKFDWYIIEADKGSLSGLIGAGKCYRDGTGVEKDLKKAREYFDKALELGSPEAAQLKESLDK
jgi:TPR repeat protein